MRPITTNVAWSVCLRVCLLDTIANPTETAEPIKMLFGVWTRVDRGNHVLGGRPDPPGKGANLGRPLRPPHSFIPDLKRSFSANPSQRSLRFLLRD